MMIIEQISIENWRGYRDRKDFAFSGDINLLIGPNEAGKTTILEALWRTFFDKHNVKSAEIQQIQPLGTSLAPRTAVIFNHSGTRYRLEKQFLEHPYAKLYKEQNSRLVLLGDQDKAESYVVAMFKGSMPGKGMSKPTHRGISEALWYLQKEGGIPSNEWNDGVISGLEGIVNLSVQTPIEKRIVNAIRDEFKRNLTDTKGEPRKNSALGQILEEIDRNEKLKSELSSKLNQANAYRVSLEGLQQEKNSKKTVLISASSLQSSLQDEVNEAEEIDNRLKVIRAELENTTRSTQTLIEMKKQIERRNREIKTLKQQLTILGQELVNSELAVNIALREENRSRDEWSVVLEPELKLIEKKIGILASLERIRNLEVQEQTISNHLKKLESVNTALRVVEIELSKLIAPTAKEVKEYKKVSLEIATTNGEINASSVRVGFDLKQGIPVIPEGDAVKEGSEYLIISPITFKLGSLGRITIRGGEKSGQELRNRLESLRTSAESILSRYAAKDEEELFLLQSRKDSLEKRFSQLKGDVETLNKEYPQADSQYDRLRKEITEEQRNSSRLIISEDQGTWGIKKVKEEQEKLNEDKVERIRKITDAQNDEKKARDNYNKNTQRSSEVKTGISSAKAKVDTLTNENAEAISSHGNLENLNKEITRSKSEEEKLKSEEKEILRNYEVKVTVPKKEYEQNSRAIENIRTRLSEIDMDISGLMARIEEIAENGTYTQLGDVVAELESQNRTKEVLERRSAGLGLLYYVLEYAEQKRAKEISLPVQRYVNRWFNELTSGTYESINLDERIKPVSATTDRASSPLPFDSLSYGTAEQLTVLVRLAMGILMSEKEKNLVVLDDSLVNADPVRLRALCVILEEAAKHCQIILSTCDDSRYLGLTSKLIRVSNL